MNFTPLTWDTSFFNFTVARVNGDIINDAILNELYQQNIQLAYFASDKKLNAIQSDLYKIKPVDKKLTYVKQTGQTVLDNTIVPYTLNYPDEALVALAIRSGKYSRFCTDEKISREKFEQLYRQWIINAVEKKIANEVLVRYQNNILAGFITIGNKNNRVDIGLVAVGESFGRQGIGKALVAAAEQYALPHYKEIQVVTQGDNIAACKLYQSCGYQVEKTEFFYHLWKK